MVTYPNDWKESNLNDIGDVLTGLTYAPDNVRSSGKLVIRSSNIQEDRLVFDDNVYVDRSCVKSEDIKKGDIIICVRNGSAALIGKSAYADFDLDATFGAFMSNFRCKNIDSSRFVYYYTKSTMFKNFVKQILGATINQITKADLKKFTVFLPTQTQEHKEISIVLSHFDEHIDNLTELIEKKKAIRDGALEDLVSGRTRVDGFDGEIREYKPIKSVYRRIKGTPITANMMNDLHTLSGDVRIFAGGSTECRAISTNIPNIKITKVPVLIVQSRGVIDFIFCNEPCTFKNEMWGYTSDEETSVKFLFYYLKHHIDHFRNEGSGRSSFSQISLPVTEEFLVPIIPIDEQKEIVNILTSMDQEMQALEIEKEKMMQIREGAMDDLLTGHVRLKI